MTFRTAVFLLPFLATHAVAQIVSPTLSQTAIVSVPGPQFGVDTGAGGVFSSRSNGGYSASVTGVGSLVSGGASWTGTLEATAPGTGSAGCLGEFRGELTFTATSAFTLDFTASMLNFEKTEWFGGAMLRTIVYRSGSEIFQTFEEDPARPLVIPATLYAAGDYRFYFSASAQSRGGAGLGPQFTRYNTSGRLNLTPVPEPASMAVLGLGLLAIRRRRSR